MVTRRDEGDHRAMNHATILLGCALPLAGCSSEPEVSARNATVEEVAGQVAEAGGGDAFVRPGKWQSRVQIEEFKLPGAPPEAAQAMGRLNERVQVAESCLTPDDAKRPKEDFFAGAGKNCRYHHFDMSGGKIDAMMNCTAEGMAQTMTMQGTYGPDSYQMQMSLEAKAGAGPPGGMTMKMRVDGKRIGECDGKAS
jgi:hypothetical protein